MVVQLQGFSSPHILIHQFDPFRKPLFRMAIFRKTRFPVKKTTKIQIRASHGDLVFEDQSTGIICYKDERGEIICEGFDEGPRLNPHSTPLPSLRDDDAIILDRLQQRWLQIMDGKSNANSSNLLEEQRSCNGSNTLH